ncbi:MAG TPA: PAS domain S-box protein, partial [Gammaproteobacteria bacterium]|nr:PAS domain S-box protein [Gammaproteobacteria bacterium]
MGRDSSPEGAPGTGGGPSLLPGFHTLRGRYLYLMGALLAFLLGAGLFVHGQVGTTVSRGISSTQARKEVKKAIGALRDNLWRAENALQRYLLVPRASDRATAGRILTTTGRQAEALARLHWIRQDAPARRKVEALRDRLAKLQTSADRLMAIRGDVSRLFPASEILQHRLRPANQRFAQAATGVIQDLHTAREDLPRPDPTDWLFAQALHAWSQRISAFRVFIANRFGIFGDPTTGMRAQASNVSLFGEKVHGYLHRLDELQRQGKLGLGENAALSRMEAAKHAWDRAYAKARRIYQSPGWRRDMPLLKNRVRPLFLDSWGLLGDIENRTGAATEDAVSVLAETAEGIKWVVWAGAVAGLLVTTLIFFFFEETIRKPVARVARALKQEGLGQDPERVPPGALRETQDLTRAFDGMREQVHSRQQRLEAILDHAAEGIATFDGAGRLRSFNAAAQSLFGYGEEAILDRPLETILAPKGEDPGGKGMLETVIQHCTESECEMTGRHREEGDFPVALKVSPMQVEGERLYTVLVEDISERKAMFERLRNMAEHDGLTGMYNRSFFQAELERTVERAGRNGQ